MDFYDVDNITEHYRTAPNRIEQNRDIQRIWHCVWGEEKLKGDIEDCDVGWMDGLPRCLVDFTGDRWFDHEKFMYPKEL